LFIEKDSVIFYLCYNGFIIDGQKRRYRNLNVAIYLRKSRADLEAEKNGEFETLDKHKSTLMDLAKNMELNILEIKEELISGESVANRPKMMDLLNEIKKGSYDAVLVMDIDRLGRGDMKDQGVILETFKNSNTKIITPRKIYDLNDEFDEEYSEFEAFMARKELKLINRRMQRGRIKSVEEGNFIATSPPYGYDIYNINKRERTLKPNENAEIVTLIYDLYINENMGGTKISDYLNKRGIKTLNGGLWYRSIIQKIINNKVYCGYIEWNKRDFTKKSKNYNGNFIVKNNNKENVIVVKGKHEPIISEDTWNKAQKIMKSKANIGHKNQLRNPFAGVLKCGVCGGILTYRPYPTKDAHLICEGRCGNKSSKFIFIEEAFIRALEYSLADYSIKVDDEEVLTDKENSKKAINEKALLKLKNELKELNKQKNKLFDLLERGIYDENTFLDRSQNIQDRINKVNEDIDEIEKNLNITEKDDKQIIAGIKKVLELYPLTDSVVEKNKLIKSVVNKAEYFKRQDQKLDQFKLYLELKVFE